MRYINLDFDYFTHPKTVRLISKLGEGSEVYPIKLWCYCGKYHFSDGILAGYEPEEIEATIGWDGEKGKLVAILLAVGLLEKQGKNYAVKDWINHNGHILGLRARAQAGAKARWANYRRQAKAMLKHRFSNAPSIPSIPSNPSIPFEEKNILPEWIKPETWEEFAEMRKRQRKPLTAGAVKRTVTELEKLKKQGQDVEAVLGQSIQRGWAGVFPVKASFQQTNAEWEADPRNPDNRELNPND